MRARAVGTWIRRRECPRPEKYDEAARQSGCASVAAPRSRACRGRGAKAAIPPSSAGRAIRPGLMHDAKGARYKALYHAAVAVMACDADVWPSESRLLFGPLDERALREIYDTERPPALCRSDPSPGAASGCRACAPPSEFLEDLIH